MGYSVTHKKARAKSHVVHLMWSILSIYNIYKCTSICSCLFFLPYRKRAHISICSALPIISYIGFLIIIEASHVLESSVQIHAIPHGQPGQIHAGNKSVDSFLFEYSIQ